VFIGQLQTASTGLTLTAADYCVFYSNSFAAGDRAQSIDRLYRIGQKRKVTYYDLLCVGSIDGYILKNLLEKRDLAIKTVGNLKEALLSDVVITKKFLEGLNA
jgi:SNF2 family DNA or RNA helicase